MSTRIAPSLAGLFQPAVRPASRAGPASGPRSFQMLLSSAALGWATAVTLTLWLMVLRGPIWRCTRRMAPSTCFRRRLSERRAPACHPRRRGQEEYLHLRPQACPAGTRKLQPCDLARQGRRRRTLRQRQWQSSWPRTWAWNRASHHRAARHADQLVAVDPALWTSPALGKCWRRSCLERALERPHWRRRGLEAQGVGQLSLAGESLRLWRSRSWR